MSSQSRFPVEYPIPSGPRQTCTNCVMDTSDARIVFDANGMCDHCQRFLRSVEPEWVARLADPHALDQVVEQIRADGRGRDFDCIMGMSGGIDSSYLLYVVKEHFGLRPLVFHVDAGWNSQIAVNNIERLIDGLELDLYTDVIDWEEMKDLQLAFFRSGVSHIDTPQDHAFFATMYQYARRHGVKYILTGANISTECVRNPVDWMYYQSDSVQLRDIHRRFGTRPLRRYPLTSILWHKLYLPYVKGIQVVRPLDYVPYHKAEAMELLASKFGWQPYPQKHFESRFTRFYESYWLPRRFGYDVRRVQYSSLILTRQMARTEALTRLEALPWDEATINQELDFVASKLDITRGDLEAFMQLPKKTYRDYKSQRWIYDIGSRMMRTLGLDSAAKR